MTSTQVERILLADLLPIVARLEALTPEEAGQARERLLAHNREGRDEGAPLTVAELAVADLDRMFCERAAQG